MARVKPTDAARAFFVDLKKSDTLHPVYLVFGEETFLLSLAVEELRKKALPGGANDFNFDVFYGNSIDPHRVVGACETLVMFGGRRLVMVKEMQRLSKTQLDVLADYLNDPCPTTTLVCHAMTRGQKKGLSKTTAFYRRAKKVGVVQEFHALRAWEVGTFLRRQARLRRLHLDRNAEDALIGAVGSDLSALDEALEKIDLFIGPREGTRNVDEDVLREVVAVTRSFEVFEFTDALAKRELGRSLALLAEMLDQGQNGISINRMVARQMRQIWQVKSAIQRGMNKNEIARGVGMNPYFVDRYKTFARQFSEPQLQRALRLTLATDRSLKSSRLKSKVVLERMVVGICQ